MTCRPYEPTVYTAVAEEAAWRAHSIGYGAEPYPALLMHVEEKYGIPHEELHLRITRDSWQPGYEREVLRAAQEIRNEIAEHDADLEIEKRRIQQ